MPGLGSAADRRAPTFVRSAALGAIALLCACANNHSIEPYRSDPEAGHALRDRAAERCRAHRGPTAVPPERAFATDGCSRFPDTEWNQACCIEHDIDYWCGGDAAARKLADQTFGRCIADRKNGFYGWLMETGVRFGGHPIWPTGYRWGYGDAYRWGYPPDEGP